MVIPDAPAPTMQTSPSRTGRPGSVLASVCILRATEREERCLPGFCQREHPTVDDRYASIREVLFDHVVERCAKYRFATSRYGSSQRVCGALRRCLGAITRAQLAHALCTEHCDQIWLVERTI